MFKKIIFLISAIIIIIAISIGINIYNAIQKSKESIFLNDKYIFDINIKGLEFQYMQNDQILFKNMGVNGQLFCKVRYEENEKIASFKEVNEDIPIIEKIIIDTVISYRDNYGINAMVEIPNATWDDSLKRNINGVLNFFFVNENILCNITELSVSYY